MQVCCPQRQPVQQLDLQQLLPWHLEECGMCVVVVSLVVLVEVVLPLCVCTDTNTHPRHTHVPTHPPLLIFTPHTTQKRCVSSSASEPISLATRLRSTSGLNIARFTKLLL